MLQGIRMLLKYKSGSGISNNTPFQFKSPKQGETTLVHVTAERNIKNATLKGLSETSSVFRVQCSVFSVQCSSSVFRVSVQRSALMILF
jgi:hypothetical protein